MFLSHKVGSLKFTVRGKYIYLLHCIVYTLSGILKQFLKKKKKKKKKKRGLLKHDHTVLFELDLSSKQDGQNAAIFFS